MICVFSGLVIGYPLFTFSINEIKKIVYVNITPNFVLPPKCYLINSFTNSYILILQYHLLEYIHNIYNEMEII